jgi:hypothetical protein
VNAEQRLTRDDEKKEVARWRRVTTYRTIPARVTWLLTGT